MTETPQVEIVVPVKNEEHDLAPSVTRLAGYLRNTFPFTTRVTIADNGSTDGTWPAARALEARFPEVRAVHLDLPGRGRALHQAWLSSDAEVSAAGNRLRRWWRGPDGDPRWARPALCALLAVTALLYLWDRVRGASCQARDPLLRRAKRQQLRRRRFLGDRLLGGCPLQVTDRRRRHGLRPHTGELAPEPVPESSGWRPAGAVPAADVPARTAQPGGHAAAGGRVSSGHRRRAARAGPGRRMTGTATASTR